MDEITPDAGLNVHVDGSDGNPLYDLIDGLIEDGVLELFSSAPYWRLPQKNFESTDYQFALAGSRYVLRFKLGDDFLRVAEINCSAFQRPITEVVSEQSPEGRRQHNPYLMGREAKPVGVMSYGDWNNTPCREIDCYSLSTDSGITVAASYIAKPAKIGDTGYTTVESVVPSVLITCLEWVIASLVFSARGDAAHSGICQQNAQNLLI